MNIYRVIILSLLVFDWLVSLIVETLNMKNVSTRIPDEFAGIYDPDQYAKSQRYLHDNTYFSQLRSSVMLPLIILFIIMGGFSSIHHLAQSVSDHMIVQGILFGGTLIILGQVISLPFAIYETFVIEERFGFNKTSGRTFIVDILKGLALSLALGSPVFALILWIFDTVPAAWIWAWLAAALIQLFVLFIAPVVILPLFNRFTPLEEGDLRSKIEAFAAKQNYRISGIFKIDGSRRSTKSNAYFTGFGRNKRIVLYDTLIEKHSEDELLAILAHEIAHNKLGHLRQNIIISLGSSLLMFYILSLFIKQEGLHQAFGISGTPLYAGIILFGFLYTPINMVLGLLGTLLSRKHEYQADAFSAQTTGRPDALIDALKKLSMDNLTNLTPHPLKVFLDYSHPPVLERIRVLRTFTAEQPEPGTARDKA